MAVQCPQFSFTKPRRLPKKRNRPSNVAFRTAATQLDFINRKAGGICIPAIVDFLSDEESDPEMEYKMVECATQKALAKQGGLMGRDIVEHKIKTCRSDSKSADLQRKRRFMVDSDDEDEHDTSSAPCLLSDEGNRQRDRLTRSRGRNIKRRRDSFLSDSGCADDQPVRKAKRPRQDLAAELDDLDIDMEGWSAPEDAPGRQRRRR